MVIFLLFFLFSLGQIGRISFFNQQVNFYLYELVMAILLLFYFLKLKFAPFKKLFKKKQWIFWGFGYLLFSFFLSFFKYSIFENIISFLYLFRLFFYFTFFVYFYFFCQKKSKNNLSVGFLVFSFLTIVSSFIQLFFYPSLRNLIYLGWDEHQNRVFGLFFDTSLAASVYGLLFLFWLNYEKYKFFCFLPFFFILLYFTYSRFAIFSFFIALFLFFLKKSSVKKFFLILTTFVFLLILFPQKSGIGVNLNRFFSIESRIKENILGIKMGFKNPLFGIGYNRIRFFRQRENLIWRSDFNIYHGATSFQSTYVTIFVSSGIFGLFFLGKGLLELLKSNQHIFYLVIFIGIASFADNLLLHPFIVFILGMTKVIFDKRL